MIRHMAAIGFVYVCTSAAWFLLAEVVAFRTDTMNRSNRQQVNHLWGSALRQSAPALQDKTEKQSFPLESSDLEVRLDLDHRKKGLLWFSTYHVDFAGRYTVRNAADRTRSAVLVFLLPDPGAVYDNFELSVGGRPVDTLDIRAGKIRHPLTLGPDQTLAFRIAYQTRGTERWGYHFGEEVEQVRNFSLNMQTNFEAIDYPEGSMSPTEARRTDEGWNLNWRYGNLLSGVQIGMQMPARLNPGPWVMRLSYAAPVSLFLFFFLILIITMRREIRMHPMNYFFLATAFFSYHLLLSYLVDHVSIHAAFWICSAVSIFLAVSYMRLVAGVRFALLETGLSQFVFLVLFSYSFFFQGHTGLTITCLCIVTLFIVMQCTGRTNWHRVFNPPAPEPSKPSAASVGSGRTW